MLYSTEEIINGCKNKEKKFQKELYDKYSSKLFALCLRYGKSKEDAEDIFQEAFIKAFSSLNKYDFKGSFEGWLRKLFVNCALNYYRNKRILVYTDKELDFNETINDTDIDLGGFKMKDIVKAIENLPDKQRIVFNMVEVEGYSYQELAKEFNEEEVSIRVVNSRAKKNLREYLNTKK